MLQAQIKHGAAHQPEKIIPVIGNYYVYPGHGVCVLRSVTVINGAGYSVKTYDFRPMTSINDKIMIPEMRLAASGVRPLSSLDDVKAAIECAAGDVRASHQIWAKRASKLEDMIATGHPVSLAAVLRDTYGKKRNKKFNGNSFSGGTVRPADLDLSYSEMQLAEKSLKLLGDEIGLVLRTEPAKVRSMLLKALLSPEFKFENLILEDRTPSGMNDKTFIELFGLSKKEAGDSESSVQISEPKMPSHPMRRPLHMDASAASRPETTKVRQTRNGRVVAVTANVSSSSRGVQMVKEDLKDIYDAHVSDIAKAGPKAAAFKFAAQRLNPPEFELLCLTYFRVRSAQGNMIEEIAREKEISSDVLWRSAETAFDKLKGSILASGNKYMAKEKFKRFGAEKKQRAPTEPKEPKDKFDDIPTENRQVYKDELKYAPLRGPTRAIFLMAARRLGPEALSIYLRMELRRVDHRLTAQQIAENDSIDAARVRDIRNAAAASMAAHFSSVSPRLLNLSLLNPLEEKTPTVRAPKPVKEPKAPRPRKEPKVRLSYLEKQVQAVPEHNLDIFEQEIAYAPERGVMRGLFLKAAQILPPQEFSVLSKMELRMRAHRMTVPDIAQEAGKDTDTIIAIRNNAAQQLKGAFSHAVGRLAQYSAFQPLRKTTRSVRAKPQLEVPADPMKVELVGRIVEGYLLVTLAVPLGAIKKIPEFTVDVSVEGEGPDHVAITGRASQGRGYERKIFSASSPVIKDRSPS